MLESRSQRSGFQEVPIYGDGGNRTRVRDRVTVTSTSISGALFSPSDRLAGGVAEGQLPEMSPVRRERTSPGNPALLILDIPAAGEQGPELTRPSLC